MRAAEQDFASDFPDLGNLEQLYELEDGGDLDANDKRYCSRRLVFAQLRL